jgi:hypothetical protein
MSSAKRYSRVAEFDEAGPSVQMDDSRDGGTSCRFGFCLRPSPQMRPGWVPGVVAGLLVVATIILVVVAAVVAHSANQTAPPAAPTPVATPCTTPSPFPVSQIKWHDCPVNTVRCYFPFPSLLGHIHTHVSFLALRTTVLLSSQ